MKRICILLPAYNEELVIGSTLGSLLDSGFLADNIFVVDDCSTDSTFKLAKKYTKNVVRVPTNGGKARAQTYALHHFDLLKKYDYVIMLDCDSTVSHNFKESVYNYTYNYPDVDLFIGQVKNSQADNLVSALRSIEYTFSHEIIKKGQANFGVIYVAPGCAAIYSTRMLAKLKLDPNVLAEDMDLTIQVHQLKGKIKYLHSVDVITQDPQSFSDYTKQITRWFRGFWQVVDKYSILRLGFHSHVALYILYLILESLIANRFLTIALFSLFMPPAIIALGFAIDFAIFFAIAVYAMIKTKRYDIWIKTPVLYLMQFYNSLIFLKSFVEVIVLRKKKFGWNKVQRYVEE
jgi:cellulose synthase/poly-beta-1,6-N-acetylglucosamine synthase-like glycosyltransferase